VRHRGKGLARTERSRMMPHPPLNAGSWRVALPLAMRTVRPRPETDMRPC